MTARIRGRLAADDGISLVEVLVGVVIIAVVMGAFAQTLAQSLTTVTRDEQLVRANQLAADVLEGIRSLAWDQVGFYADDAGYAGSAADGADMVTLGPVRPAATAAPRPSEVITRDGIDYTATYEIVWQDDPDQPPAPLIETDPNDYKELRVTLDWAVRDRAFTTSSVSVRQPTTDEVPLEAVPDCVPGTITDFDVSPDFVEVSASGITQEDITVTVTTCTEASQVRLHPAPLADFNMTVDTSSNNTFFTIDPFRRGVTQFDPGTYTWTAVSTSPYGSDAAEVEVTFYEPLTSVLQVQSLDVSPAGALCVQNNGRTIAAQTLTARITGAGQDDRVVVSWTSQNGSATGTFAQIDANGHGVFTATIPSDHKFNRSLTSVSVSVTRTSSDSLNVTQNFDVPIVDQGTAPCT